MTAFKLVELVTEEWQWWEVNTSPTSFLRMIMIMILVLPVTIIPNLMTGSRAARDRGGDEGGQWITRSPGKCLFSLESFIGKLIVMLDKVMLDKVIS